MISLCLVAAAALQTSTLRVLFLGNSHTQFNNVPQMVANLLTTPTQRIEFGSRSTAFLEELAASKEVKTELATGKWRVVVMQGAKLSSSHKYEYPHDGAVDLARIAKAAGSRVLLFAEWPRKDWKETDYILKEYTEISKPSGAEIVRIPVVWDTVLSKAPTLNLWSGDGNHAAPMGSYLAAVCLATTLRGKALESPWRPEWITANTAGLFTSEAGRILLPK